MSLSRFIWAVVAQGDGQPPSAWNIYADRDEAEAGAFAATTNSLTGRTYEVVTFEEWQRIERGHWLAGPLREITPERYDDLLNVLPPVAWERRDGVERFCLRELTVGTITMQCAKVGGRCFARNVDVTDRSTWITGDEVARLLASPVPAKEAAA
jgi:hypothetical protein